MMSNEFVEECRSLFLTVARQPLQGQIDKGSLIPSELH